MHLRGLAVVIQNSEETSQQWRAIGHTVSDLTCPVVEPATSRPDSNVLSKVIVIVSSQYSDATVTEMHL